MSNLLYLVLCYTNEFDNYIWVGGKQNDRLTDARYWETEEEAQEVADKNNENFKLAMEGHDNYVLIYKVIPMDRKVYMKHCLIEE